MTFIPPLLLLPHLRHLPKSQMRDSAGLSHSSSLGCVRQAHVAYKNSINLHRLDITLVEAAFVSAMSQVLITF